MGFPCSLNIIGIPIILLKGRGKKKRKILKNFEKLALKLYIKRAKDLIDLAQLELICI